MITSISIRGGTWLLRIRSSRSGIKHRMQVIIRDSDSDSDSDTTTTSDNDRAFLEFRI